MSLAVFYESVELAVEASASASSIGLSVEPVLSATPLDAAAHHVQDHAGPALALSLALPSAEEGVRALHVCSKPEAIVVAAISDPDGLTEGLLADLGFVCTREVAPAVAALALLAAGQTHAYRASSRKLNAPDRERLRAALGAGSDKAAGRLLSLGAQGIALETNAKAPPIMLGPANATAAALTALAAAAKSPDADLRFSLPAELESSRDVLFGPPRLLSDPASKAALAPFGLPMPQEELCTSPSRAAVEAARIGFPVRISLASPDLRIWDHPDLSVDGVDNAARVRDVFRQLTTVAGTRAPSARVLGVTVTATTLASALLRVAARPLPEGHVLLRVGFCDPHGTTVKDRVATVLPASRSQLLRTFARLSGHALLGPLRSGGSADGAPLVELCVRLGSFIDHFRREVARVELYPIALLVGGGAEVREAAVQVTDAFVQDVGG